MKNIGETYDIVEKSIIIIAIYDIQHMHLLPFLKIHELKPFLNSKLNQLHEKTTW